MDTRIIEQAKTVLKLEAQGILGLIKKLGRPFEQAVEIVLSSKGRVILTGMGKSGIIGRKIAATLTSTGTPSSFLHPAEAIHGDLGMVTKDDVVIAISNSGRTQELNRIMPVLKEMGVRIIGLLGDVNSPMAQYCDVTIDVGVEREACPLGLAPTASTTAALAMGDALAVVLLKQRRFGEEDFQRFHPGGSLGERLRSKVWQVMTTGERVPMVSLGTPVLEAVKEIDAKKLGATLVVADSQRAVGIITDGDLRRALLKGLDFTKARVEDIMTPSPRSVYKEESSANALAMMELYEIMHLVVVDEKGLLAGLLHLHDLLGRYEFRYNGIK